MNMPEENRTAVVLGAGTMGSGIAQVLASGGFETELYDLNLDRAKRGVEQCQASLARAVEKGKLTAESAAAIGGRIRPVVNYDGVDGAELVIEAVPEDLQLKRRVFREISERNDSGILASNTSSLSVTEIAAHSLRPDRVLGLHFFNPAPIMPLIEIVCAEQTSHDIILRARGLADQLGKTPIVVNDSPGFATSRLGIILGMEAIRMLESCVASAADIDRAMELGYKHPIGPLKLTDLVGLDVRLAIAEHLTREIGPQFQAPPLLRRLVRAGKLGKKSGEGFYLWDGDTAHPKD